MREESNDTRVFIVGGNDFANSILMGLLEKEEGYACGGYEDLDELKTCPIFLNGTPNKLLLWDCQSCAINELWSELSDGEKELPEAVKIAVFNAPLDSDIGVCLLKHGGHGVFFQKDTPDMFVKGVRAVLGGELWVSRDIVNRYIRRSRKVEKKDKAGLLTNREKDILGRLSSGASNETIADLLNISPHTVRTHLSNIYGKLEVSNRFQAALWASENLE